MSIKYLEEFRDLLERVNNDYEKSKDDLSKIDLEKSDLEHILELSVFNASEGYKIAKLLQDVLKRRRDIKNRKEILQKTRDKLNKYKGIQSDLNDISNRISSRTYRTRVLRDIFGDKIDDNYKIPELIFEE